MMVIQKAIAKAYGGYSKIVGHKFKEDIFYSMTGQHETIYNFENRKKDEIWDVITKGKTQDYAMVISADEKENLPNKRPQGIVLNHQYSLLGCATAYKADKDIKLLHLRNPWGNYEWNLEWSRDSNVWPPKEKERLGVQRMGDGEFFIPLNRIKDYFQRIKICEHRSNLIKKGVSMLTYDQGFACFYLDPSESGFYDIRCSLLNYEVQELDGQLKTMQRSTHLKIFEQFEAGNYFLVAEKNIISTDTKLAQELRVGSRYLVVAEIKWSEADQNKAVHFDVSSKDEFELNVFSELNCLSLIYHLLLSRSRLCARQPRDELLSNYNEYNLFNSIKALYWKNQSVDMNIYVQFTIKTAPISVYPEQNQTKLLQFQLKPEEEKFILYSQTQQSSQFLSNTLKRTQTANLQNFKRKILEQGQKQVLFNLNSGNILEYTYSENTGYGYYFEMESTQEKSYQLTIRFGQQICQAFNFIEGDLQPSERGNFEIRKILSGGDGFYVIARYKDLNKRARFSLSFGLIQS